MALAAPVLLRQGQSHSQSRTHGEREQRNHAQSERVLGLRPIVQPSTSSTAALEGTSSSSSSSSRSTAGSRAAAGGDMLPPHTQTLLAPASTTSRPVLGERSHTTTGALHHHASLHQHQQQPHGHGHHPSQSGQTSFASSSSSTLAAGGSLGSGLAPPHLNPHASASSLSLAGSEHTVQSSGSIVNRTANAQYGLYQQCLTLQKRLRRVPGFAERYLASRSTGGAQASNGHHDREQGHGGSSQAGPGSLASSSSSSVGAYGSSNIDGARSSSTSLNSDPASSSSSLPMSSASINGGGGVALSSSVQSPSSSSTLASISHPANVDPVTLVCGCLRLGSSLAYIFNQLNQGPPLDVDPQATPNNLKACKKAAAHFIMACNTRLGWPYDEMFSTTELFSQSTNGTVKVLSTVSKLLSLLESHGMLLPEEDDERQDDASSSTGGLGKSQSLDNRGQVAREILESERKYVQDLEVLQDYKRRLSEESILSRDTIHYIFLNLDEIVDFARRFLVLVEQVSRQPPEQQRFGHIFLTTESQFSIYNHYCVHFASASDLAASIARQENTPLARLSHVLDPIVELTMFHIKPLQRVTKYHLLWKQLLKASDPSGQYYQELSDGTAAAERIADRVNEAIRVEENRMAVEDLKERVEDWKGHDLALFGDLILHDTFQVLKSEVEREYLVYLFQKIILCCKEVTQNGKAKVSKSNSVIRKSASSSAPGTGGAGSSQVGRKKTPLQLKGRIFINNVISATPSTARPNTYMLQVAWRGDTSEEAFGIKCRTPDQLNQWQKAVLKAVEEAAAQRRSRTAGQMSARRLASPHSQFPNTPQFELGPMGSANSLHGDSHLHYTNSAASLGASSYSSSHHPYGGTFDDNDEDGYVGDYEPSTGRSTPSLTAGDRSMMHGGGGGNHGSNARRGPGTQSMPASIRQDRSGESGRPRAQTEDSNSAVIHQWRSQTPNGAYPAVPSLPRQSSGSSAMSSSSVHNQQQQQEQSLRHSASRGGLRSKPSHEWSAPPLPPPSSSGSTVTQYTSASLPPGGGRALTNQMAEMGFDGGADGSRMLRQNSQGSMPPYATAPPMRSRSASSPNVYQLQPGQTSASQRDNQWSPYPVQNVHPSHFMAGQAANQTPTPHSHQQMHHQASMSLKRGPGGGNGSNATIASTHGSSTTSQANRLSSSSTGTDRSSAESGQSHGGLPYHSPTSPTAGMVPYGGANGVSSSTMGRNGSLSQQSQAPLSPSSPSAVKIRVNYGEDTFVIVVLTTTSYNDLVEKVVRKVQLCGARKGVDAASLRIRYEDEEGDKILISADEDVAMAFDWLKSGGAQGDALIIYAD